MSDVEILREFMLTGDPVLTTSELTEPLGMSRQGIHSRLEDLQERGLLKSKQVGSKARVWWITDNGRNYVSKRRQSEA